MYKMFTTKLHKIHLVIAQIYGDKKVTNKKRNSLAFIKILYLFLFLMCYIFIFNT